MMKKLLLFVLLALPAPALAQNTYDQNGRLLTTTTITDGTDTALVTAAGELNTLCSAQPGVDIGDVTINNGAGAAAVNIQDGGNSITVDGTVACNATQTTSPWVTNVTQFGSSNVVTGTGASGAGIPRVTISNDSSLAANQSVNVAQVGGASTNTGLGTASTGTARVAQASDTTLSVSAANNDGACVTVTGASGTALASNASRRGFTLYALSTNTGPVYVKFGATATTSDFPMPAGSVFNMSAGTLVYTGVIDAIRSGLVADQSLCVVEF